MYAAQFICIRTWQADTKHESVEAADDATRLPYVAEGEEGKPTTEYACITELQRLRCMLDDVTTATNLAPVGSQLVNAHDEVVPNPMFSSLDYPDKLESFFHQHLGPASALLLLHCVAFENLVFDPGLCATMYSGKQQEQVSTAAL